MKQIHDSKIVNYQIDFESLKIEMTIVSEREEKEKIVFEDLYAFHFEDQLPNSILLDIVEEEIDLFVVENKELLEKGKSYYWPMDYNDIKELVHYIKKNNYHYYKVQASYGLNGWVMSKRMLVKD